MAALIQEINLTQARHIITIEQPIEYQIRPQLSFVRQREVGRDTPSFDQALIDALPVDGVDTLQRVLDASRIERAVSMTVVRGAQRLELTVTPVEQTG